MNRKSKFVGGWHRLLTIWGDTSPEVSKKYYITWRGLVAAARKNSEGGKNGVYCLSTYANGDTEITPFSGFEIEG